MESQAVLKIVLLFGVLTGVLTNFAKGRADAPLIDNVEAIPFNFSVAENKKTHRLTFELDTQLLNHSETSLMEIKYRFSFLDRSGAEIHALTIVWNGQDTPLKPGEKILHNFRGQIPYEGNLHHVTAEVLGVTTEEEMPPIHVPQPDEFLYQALANEDVNQIRENPPVSVKLWIDRSGDVTETVLDTPEELAAFTEAFTKVRIAGESGMWATDNYNGLSLTFANGETYTIGLNLNSLEYRIYGKEYVFELKDDDAFWKFFKR